MEFYGDYFIVIYDHLDPNESFRTCNAQEPSSSDLDGYSYNKIKVEFSDQNSILGNIIPYVDVFHRDGKPMCRIDLSLILRQHNL